MKMPTVSAVIPAYNAAETIERALASVYAQTYDRIIEVIVVDDGSTDSTAEVVGESYPDAILVRQENGGDAAARNGGIRRAGGDYIAFLDADDEWVPEKTQVQMEVLLRHPAVRALTCHTHVVADGEDPADPAAGCRMKIAGDAFLNLTSFKEWVTWFTPPAGCLMLPNASGLVIDRALFDEIGLMDESVPGSVEILIRASGLGHSVGVVGESLSVVHAEAGSYSRSASGKLDVADMACAIVPAYDPSGTGWASELLSEEQYRKAMYEANLFGAEWAASAGEMKIMTHYLAEALRQGHAGALQAMGLRLGIISPRLYSIGQKVGRRIRHMMSPSAERS